ncbi:hypothetical protein BGY98DRAFT_935454 [Russula aff. rugulosa BPL654]|nr:hypothetical protein BGY98DRAFT_935454 [Russula aff. rugulosa BPL654]
MQSQPNRQEPLSYNGAHPPSVVRQGQTPGPIEPGSLGRPNDMYRGDVIPAYEFNYSMAGSWEAPAAPQPLGHSGYMMGGTSYGPRYDFTANQFLDPTVPCPFLLSGAYTAPNNNQGAFPVWRLHYAWNAMFFPKFCSGGQPPPSGHCSGYDPNRMVYYPKSPGSWHREKQRESQPTTMYRDYLGASTWLCGASPLRCSVQNNSRKAPREGLRFSVTKATNPKVLSTGVRRYNQPQRERHRKPRTDPSPSEPNCIQLSANDGLVVAFNPESPVEVQ